MTKTTHDTLTITRKFTASPDAVFDAFASREAMEVWASPGEGITSRVDPFDFREGGLAVTTMTMEGAPPWVNEDRFQSILPGRRIIQTSTLRHDDTLTFAGVVTLEFMPDDAGSILHLTETGVFPDGLDQSAEHEAGWGAMLNLLEEYLAR